MDNPQIIKQVKCSHCGYEWYPRAPSLPKVCPNCKYRHWNEEVKNVKDAVDHKIEQIRRDDNDTN